MLISTASLLVHLWKTVDKEKLYFICVLFYAKLTTGIIQRVYSSINKLEIAGEHTNDTKSILYKGILPS